MHNLIGKTLVFTDIHFGLNQNSEEKLNIAINVINSISELVDTNAIKNIIFLGDLFHSRRNVDIKILNIAFTLISDLSKKCKIYLIVGNHDIYYNVKTTVNSPAIFGANSNIIVVDKFTDILLNNYPCALIPWHTEEELNNSPKRYYKMLFGHFNFSSKFIVKHSNLTDNKIHNVDDDDVFIIGDDDIDIFELNSGTSTSNTSTTTTEYSNTSKSSISLLTDALVDDGGGTIFSGHIHMHNEFLLKNKYSCIIVGSPYQQNVSACRNESGNGVYIINEDMEYSFLPFNNIPKYVIININDLIGKDISNVDLSNVNGNIVKKSITFFTDDDDIKKKQLSDIERQIDLRLHQYSPLIVENTLFSVIDKTTDTNNNINTKFNDANIQLLESTTEYLTKYISSIREEQEKEQKEQKDSRKYENIDINILNDMLLKYFNNADYSAFANYKTNFN